MLSGVYAGVIFMFRTFDREAPFWEGFAYLQSLKFTEVVGVLHGLMFFPGIF